jgi:bifunctional DNA-binding transcriptional regulator/antitoxin component of YhaV-PrlF toxin-antitoxin module
MVMPETATVTSESMVDIPTRLRARHKIRPGSKTVFIEKGSESLLVPVPAIDAPLGIDRDGGQAFREVAQELNVERRQEGRVP